MTATVIAYTDGACSGNPGAGAWAYRIEWPDGAIDEAAGGGLDTTNNREELKAVREALLRIRARIGDDPAWRIVVRTDSLGVINWLTGSWKRKKNLDLYPTIDPLIDSAGAIRARARSQWQSGERTRRHPRGGGDAADHGRPRRRRWCAMTYSIVARDPQTGDLGVAVQSHWFSVGSGVTWAESGVGAIATQSFAEPAYGPRGLALLRLGVDPVTALAALTGADADQGRRQVAFVDAGGRVAVHTGDQCIEAAGHVTAGGVSCQANMMRGPEVWPAMLDAYQASDGDLADRLMAALDAAEAAGGDIRGRQSAAMLIVKATGSGQPWQDRIVDLRVDDAPDPLGELRRLLVRAPRLRAHGGRRAARDRR